MWVLNFTKGELTDFFDVYAVRGGCLLALDVFFGFDPVSLDAHTPSFVVVEHFPLRPSDLRRPTVIITR